MCIVLPGTKYEANLSLNCVEFYRDTLPGTFQIAIKFFFLLTSRQISKGKL